MGARRRITVRTWVEVESADGIETFQMEREAGFGNPLFVTRVAHRTMEEIADELRIRLQVPFGEIDEKWRESKPTRDPETGEVTQHGRSDSAFFEAGRG